MSGTKAFSIFLIMALMLCIGSKGAFGQKGGSFPPRSNDASKCCRDHSQLGNCVPGVDDINGGKCWDFCIGDCERGGFCKAYGNTHKCHCYC